MRDDRACLQDILEAIERIEKYASGGRDAFDGNELVQTWTLHNLLVIGEAARGLSPVFRQQYPDRIWAEAIGRRNILIHHYFGIDRERVWLVVERDLPVLKKRVQEILALEE